MSQLFIQLYLDENVDVRVADILRGRGFDATTTRDGGRLGATDEEQLAYAAERRMAVVTHNRVHFEVLAKQYLATGRHHWGIIAAVRRTPPDLARRLLVILNAVTADEMVDQLRYI